MSLKDRGGAFETMENLQEDRAFTAIEEALDAEEFRERICRCDACLVDMLALALNSLPPMYVADRYNKFSTLPDEERFQLHTLTEIVREAIRKVARGPRHGQPGQPG